MRLSQWLERKLGCSLTIPTSAPVEIFARRRGLLKKLAVLALAAVLGILPIAAQSSTLNVYGESGLIEVPDDATIAPGEVAVAYHGVYNIGSSTEDVGVFCLGVGILPNLSASAAFWSDGESATSINAKYRISPETVTRPSITVGVIDIASDLTDDNPALYVVLGKNLTTKAETIAGRPSKPLRGYLGFGTGMLEGVFVGLDWTLTPQLSAKLEWVGSDQGYSGDSHLNAGASYEVSKGLKIEAGLMDLKDVTIGVSYAALKF